MLVKEPVPEPSTVWALNNEGFGALFQHTPRAVTSAPLLSVTLPPQVAEVEVMSVTLSVVTVGKYADVLSSRRQRTE